MTTTLISSIVTIAVGLGYTIMTLQLPDATIGRALEPKIFPAILGISITILGLVLLFQEMMKVAKDKDSVKKENAKLVIDSNLKKIVITIINALLYAILFPRLGYVISTFLFLEIELFIFSGFKSWKVSSLVAILFSLIAFLIFSKVLGIYLPLSPLGFI